MKIGICMSTVLMGGRKTPPNLDDYRPTVYFNGAHHSVLISGGGTPGLGYWTEAELTFLQEPSDIPTMFTVHEGEKLVGWVELL